MFGGCAPKHDHFQMRPDCTSAPDQFNAVHRAGHSNIGEQHMHWRVTQQYRQCLVRIGGLKDGQAKRLKLVNDQYPDESFVFDDQDGACPLLAFHDVRPTPVWSRNVLASIGVPRDVILGRSRDGVRPVLNGSHCVAAVKPPTTTCVAARRECLST